MPINREVLNQFIMPQLTQDDIDVLLYFKEKYNENVLKVQDLIFIWAGRYHPNWGILEIDFYNEHALIEYEDNDDNDKYDDDENARRRTYIHTLNYTNLFELK